MATGGHAEWTFYFITALSLIFQFIVAQNIVAEWRLKRNINNLKL